MRHVPRKNPLSIAIASLWAGISLPALAQERMELVAVTASPIKDSQAAAFETKYLADNYVDVISADTIGRFPDQNLADSLGRLPGLAIERDQGQARYINLRGAPFRYTSIAFDGIDVPGSENGRIPRFDSFPSVITSKIEANKAILPSMPGESVAGFINIHTFSPFSREGWSGVADVGLGEQQLGDGDVEKYALRTSWSNSNFGVVGFVSENSREQVTDNREFDLERDANGELVTNELDFRSYKVKREDASWGGTVEYQGESTLQRLFLSTLYTEFVDREERNQFVFGFADPQPGIAGAAREVDVSRMLEYGRYENSTLTSTLGGDLQLGQWLVEGRFNVTETEFDTYLPIIRSTSGSAVASYDLHDIEDPKLWLDRNLAGLDYAGGTIGLVYDQALEIDADKIKLDAEREFSWFDRNATVRIGAQRDKRDAKGHVNTSSVSAFPSTVDIADFNTGRLWDSNTSNTIGATYYDNAGLRHAWAATGTLGARAISPANQISIEEEILAAYAMVTTQFGWGNIVAGARIEQTDYSSTGTIDGSSVAVDDKFTNVLPSVHVNIDLAENVKLRFSGSSGLNRPTYNEWRAAASVDVANREVRGGNPTLEPEEAVGADAAIEWYFAEGSILSVGAFYRQVDNVIYADSTLIDGGIYLPSAAGENWEYTGSVNGKDGKMQGAELNFVGHAGNMLGPWLDGFGISLNATFLDSEFQDLKGETYDLPGTSDLLYNASLFYENHGISARVNYQYRDEWISPIEDPSEYWGEQERVDASISYELPFDLNNAILSVYANGNNLTDETDVRYAGNGTINQAESYGRHWLVGLRASF